MRHILSALFLTAAAPLPSLAQPPGMVIRMTVSPAAAPRPALRYLLLPEQRELSPGNPIPAYLRCVVETESDPDRTVPTGAALREVDRAARLDQPDWQILLRAKADGFGLLLPDVQKLRLLALGLKDRFQSEVARRRLDDAVRTAQTMFAMARHLSEHPTLIGDLVGVAIASQAIGPLEDMLQRPDCPNLYWALTNLPSPFIPLAKGMEGERLFLRAEFHEWDETVPMSPEQFRKLTDHIDRILAFESNRQFKGTRAWLEAHKDSVDAARRRLIESGFPEDRLKRFPADQILLLDERREFEVLRDEVGKLVRLPYWQAEAIGGPGKLRYDHALFGEFVPAIQKVHRAQARLDQRLALLRLVEALRLYAAAHGGELPRRLADISVPLPADPFTGKPFPYHADGATASLQGKAPKGEERNEFYNIRYEVTVRR